MSTQKREARKKLPQLTVIDGSVAVAPDGRSFTSSGLAAFLRVLAERWRPGCLTLVGPRAPATSKHLVEITNFVDEVHSLPWHERPALGSKAAGFIRTFVLMRKYIAQADSLYISLVSYWGTIAAFWAVRAKKPMALEISGDIRKALPATSGLHLSQTVMRTWAIAWDVVMRWSAKHAAVVVASEGKLLRRYPGRTSLVFSPFFTVLQDEFYLRTDSCQSIPIKLLYVGALASHKGVQTLIRTMRLLPKGKYRLILVGQDRTAGQIRSEVERLFLSDSVSFMGYISHGPQLWQLCREADIFILPSLTEGTPRVLYEAMSQSLPIVTTPVGAIPEFLEHEKTALFVKPESAEEIAEAVLRITGNRELRQRLIKNGFEKLQELVSDDWLQTVVDILKDGNKENAR